MLVFDDFWGNKFPTLGLKVRPGYANIALAVSLGVYWCSKPTIGTGAKDWNMTSE